MRCSSRVFHVTCRFHLSCLEMHVIMWYHVLAYFIRYAPAQRTTWQDPRFLPSGWQQHVAPNALVYYTRPKAGVISHV